MSRKSQRRGFTLLDSLVAAAILALAIPPMFLILRSSVGREAANGRRTEQARLANNLLTEGVAVFGQDFGVRTGVVGDLGWTFETERGDDSQHQSADVGANTLVHMRVTVRPLAGGNFGEYVLETLVLVTPAHARDINRH